jgi:hypothetical protein
MPMKNLLLIVIAVLIASCGPDESDKQRFRETYKEILVVRELESDSAEANRKVSRVLEEHGFTEPEFRQLYFELAENREEFIDLMDTVRARARREAEQKKKQSINPDSSNLKIIRNPGGESDE